MERMDSLTPDIKCLFQAREDRPRKLAALSFPEKVRDHRSTSAYGGLFSGRVERTWRCGR